MEKNFLIEFGGERNEVFQKISQNIRGNPELQLLDWLREFRSGKRLERIQKAQLQSGVALGRGEYYVSYNRIAKHPVMEALTRARLNCFTRFEENPPLYFGVGGGSRMLCRGLPFDILAMILAGEKLRKELNLGKCYIVLADRITYTNVGKADSDFTKGGIDRVLRGEKKLLEIVFRKLGIEDHWIPFLETRFKEVLGESLYKVYEETISDADSAPFMGGHHYAEETAITEALVNQGKGGIKLGWFIREPPKIGGHFGYVMDEQPFDVRFILYTAHKDLPNRVSFVYTKAGLRLFPGKTGLLEKVAPYLCYQPEKRILLHPKEDPVKKLGAATKSGGGFNFAWTREFFQGICLLFEELILKKEILVPKEETFPGERIARKMEEILRFIFQGKEGEEIWETTFPDTTVL